MASKTQSEKSNPSNIVLKKEVPENRQFDKVIALNLQLVISALTKSVSLKLTLFKDDSLKTEYEHKQLLKEVYFIIESGNAEPTSFEDIIWIFPR